MSKLQITDQELKRTCLVALGWAAMPVFFWCVLQVHKPGHADIFWLPALPILMAADWPSMLIFGDDPIRSDYDLLSALFNSAICFAEAGVVLFAMTILGKRSGGK